MLNLFRPQDGRSGEAMALANALDAVKAVIWFDDKGQILRANDLFLDTMGYGLDEIVGRHHEMFLEPGESGSPDYRRFWEALGRGEAQHGEYARKARNGGTVWLEADYIPVRDETGKVSQVVKFATDITARKIETLDAEDKMAAIDANQAVIEFTPMGEILTANTNFLETMGYSLDEIRGKHHKMFLSGRDAAGPDYATFWTDLASGKPKSGIFQRVNKSGEKVWLRAIYTGIRSHDGSISKVVKFATDITATQNQAIDYRGKIEGAARSQAMIEFKPDGTILDANQNFLDAVGYRIEEIRGKHHRIFMDPEEAKSPDYAAFWSSLASGEYSAGRFRRVTKDGREIFIEATYNPIMDEDGKVVKVVKFATDVTTSHRATEGMARAIHALASNQNDIRMGPEVAGEFAELRDAFNLAMTRRADLVQPVIEACESMLAETDGLAENAAKLARRAEAQAATLEETAAAMAEISATVDRTAENATTAETSAKEASRHAEQGRSVVAEATSAMGRIENGSKQISSIVETINAISFQTNLLALNAGVEAARAGDAGRGFAVVASEVRALAQRAAEASKEIEALIESNSKQVSDGVGHVTRTGEVLSQIVTAVESVMTSVTEISHAASEQVTGIREISSATMEMDQATQQTAQLAEASSAGAAALKDRSRALLELAETIRKPADEKAAVEASAA